MQKKKLVIFDFDGVIVNTHDVSFGLNKEANPHLTPELYSQMSHGNFYDSYESVKFTPHPNFREHYEAGIVHIDPPKGIVEAIRSLSERCTLAVVSSAHSISINFYFDKEKVTQYFNDILGADLHRSKVVKLKQLLEKYSLEPSDTVFITDTLGDINEANEVGIKSIGVLWGLHDRETLERGKPAIIIDNPSLLEETIEKILRD